jgi:hypothetical protein
LGVLIFYSFIKLSALEGVEIIGTVGSLILIMFQRKSGTDEGSLILEYSDGSL